MSIKENYKIVIKKIEEVCRLQDINMDDIKLVVVTKTHSAETIKQALVAGAKYIGENKIQEAQEKLPILDGQYEEFHFIGHLQSNKIKQLMKLKPALIHSIDKLSTAEKLSNYCVNEGILQDILIQVNTTEENSKSGTGEEEVLDLIKEVAQLPNIKIKGLMTIGLFDENPEVTRPYFRNLKRIYDYVASLKIDNVEMNYLSMGMTHDFEIAIEEGANIVRIGSAVFGARDYSKEEK
ncbi:YggS family pyridoxal phosphate-dependent enzyme [bacterium]|nr:YggS family pyridoxal phosphate-dependent enzyme [bacterium]